MMTSLAQNFQPHPGGMQQHPGVPQGHPMAGPHNPNQGQPGPGMPQQMHMGVSGPGPQVSQAGAMMGGMPPGVGGPSAHALQHLNPGQAQQAQFLQQQQMFANNPQMQQMQQQQLIVHRRQQEAARQAMLAQQYSGMQSGMPAAMNQMTQAQYQAMRGAPMARPVNLPQHLQQQQQQAQAQAQHTMEQQQAQVHAQQQHQQQQILVAQQRTMHHANQGGGNVGQQNQLNAQQIQNMQHLAQQQAHQQQQQQQHTANQQNQQAQNQAQQPQPTQQPQAQGQPQTQGQPGLQQQQHQAAQAAAIQQRQQLQVDRFKGQYLLKMMQFSSDLSKFTATGKRDDLNYWVIFVEKFFSRGGVFRHSLWLPDESTNKQFEVTFPALARYFHTHFESGVTRMQMMMEGATEKDAPNNSPLVNLHLVESARTTFIYFFDADSQFIANGNLKVLLDPEQKIELFEFVTTDHKGYYPMNRVVEAARPIHEWQKEWHKVNAPPDGKSSPEMNKKKAKAMKSPQQPPPEIDLPRSKVSSKMGITASVFRFLEFAEVMGQMNPLFQYSHTHQSLAPYGALEAYVTENVTAVKNAGVSPAIGSLQLPGSPHITGSPAQAPGMLPQHSQHGTNSSGPSANTSPNASNKRRRPSTVKAEEDGQVNGTPQTKNAVKPSPRIGGKRQKGNPA